METPLAHFRHAENNFLIFDFGKHKEENIK